MKNNFIKELINRFPVLENETDHIEKATQLMIESLAGEGTLFFCGNGGSASDAEHIVGELLKGFVLRRPLKEYLTDKLRSYGEYGEELAEKLQYGLRAISLTSHPAFATAFGNDVDGTMIFAQQLLALGKKNDVVMGISTSGCSINIYKCFITARAIGLKTILLTGKRRGSCAELADCVISVPEVETFKIQELHLPIYHTICLILEDFFYGID